MKEDKEISALAAVTVALAGLEQDAAALVLRWAADRFKVTLQKTDGRGSGSGKKALGSGLDIRC
jgi:hypothetical protein